MNFGYLERGSLIKIGTILKVNGSLKEVVGFHDKSFVDIHQNGRVIECFKVDVAAHHALESDGILSFSKEDLENMLESGDLKIYNES